MHLGKLIKAARAKKVITQDQLAELIGRSRSTIGSIEQKGKINTFLLQKIEEAFEMEIGTLNNEMVNEPPTYLIGKNEEIEALKKENEILKQLVASQILTIETKTHAENYLIEINQFLRDKLQEKI